MPAYIITVKDTEDLANVKVSFESEGMELVDEESKAFQLCAYILDCIQHLEGADNATQH
tara:strand:+ start:8850 stop:9026 length:177 start_codon:yes stop_codon:yes gene_type:complete